VFSLSGGPVPAAWRDPGASSASAGGAPAGIAAPGGSCGLADSDRSVRLWLFWTRLAAASAGHFICEFFSDFATAVTYHVF